MAARSRRRRSIRWCEPRGRPERVCAPPVYVLLNAHLFIIYGSVREGAGSQPVLPFTALTCPVIQQRKAISARPPQPPPTPTPAPTQRVVFQVRGRYLSRLCGSIIRISSTCYPLLCVRARLLGADLAPPPRVFLLLWRVGGGGGGGPCVPLIPALLLATHPCVHQKECWGRRGGGDSSYLRERQPHSVLLRGRKGGNPPVTGPILARYSQRETSLQQIHESTLLQILLTVS